MNYRETGPEQLESHVIIFIIPLVENKGGTRILSHHRNHIFATDDYKLTILLEFPCIQDRLLKKRYRCNSIAVNYNNLTIPVLVFSVPTFKSHDRKKTRFLKTDIRFHNNEGLLFIPASRTPLRIAPIPVR